MRALAQWSRLGFAILAVIGMAASSSMASLPAPDDARFILFFDPDRSELSPLSLKTLSQVATAAKSNFFDGRVTVSGHADSVENNFSLSDTRALAVRDKLVELGVAKERVSIESWANKKPLVPAKPNVGEPENRRVEIRATRACIPNCPPKYFSGSSRD